MSIGNPKARRWICYKMQSEKIINCNFELWNFFFEENLSDH